MKTAKTVNPRVTPGKWAFLAGLMCLGALFTAPAKATVGAISDIPALAAVEYMPEKDFDAATKEVSETPFGDKALNFTVRLPKNWTAEVAVPSLDGQEGLSKRVLGEILRYVSPTRLERRSYFTLEALEQTYEVSARNWLINYLVGNGVTINALSEQSERVVEALYVQVHGDSTMAVRVKAIINGPRVVLARYYVPQQDFVGERVLQAQVIASFELPNVPEGGIEKWETYGFLDQSYFDYPASWKLSAPQIKSIERMRASLHTGKVENSPDGQINVYVTSRLLDINLADEIKKYRDSFVKIPGYKLGKRIEEIKSPYHDNIEWGAMELYELTPDSITMSKYELAVAVLQGDDYYYFIMMLTPARTVDFYVWSRNMRTFRIIAETMRRDPSARETYNQNFIE